MNSRELFGKLSGMPPEKYGAIIRSVAENKAVFGGMFYSPNPIDCIDQAVKRAESMHRTGQFEEARHRLFSFIRSCS